MMGICFLLACLAQVLAVHAEGPAFAPGAESQQLSKGKSQFEAPYQVGLVYAAYDNAREGYFCSGSLIASEWVVTAAHCLSRHAQASDFKVAAGSAQLSRSHLISVAKIVRHEKFDSSSLKNDIALIRLARPADHASSIALADLTVEARALESHVRATINAWGATSFLNRTVSDQLLSVSVPIRKRRACNRSYNGAVTSRMLCAGDKGADACLGDSGAGLVITYEGHLYLEGIVSWGEGCGDPAKPGVYTRVPSYLEWINKHMN